MNEAGQSNRVCPNCDAAIWAHAKRCSKCGFQKSGSPQFSQPAFETRASTQSPTAVYESPYIQKGTASSFSIASLLIVITVIGVLLGIAVQAPGLAILLALLAVPPWIRTALVIRRRRAMGIQPSASDRVALFMGSMFVTWVIVLTLVVSCCLTFCAVCIGAFSLGNPMRGDESLLWVFIWSSVLAVAGLLVFLFSFWIRARWRRHTDPDRIKR